MVTEPWVSDMRLILSKEPRFFKAKYNAIREASKIPSSYVSKDLKFKKTRKLKNAFDSGKAFTTILTTEWITKLPSTGFP